MLEKERLEEQKRAELRESLRGWLISFIEDQGGDRQKLEEMLSKSDYNREWRYYTRELYKKLKEEGYKQKKVKVRIIHE
jgi:hypothetical protein